MAERVVLHIGVQKSGTTYLQRMMQDRTKELAQTGVLYPLPARRRLTTGRVNHHELATYGLLGAEYPWVAEDRARGQEAWWDKLRAVVSDWSDMAIVSAEALSVVRPDAARRTVDALGGVDNVEVVITARGLGKLLPSAWQQQVRNGRTIGLHSFMRNLVRQREHDWDDLDDDLQMHRWRAFALGRLARRWADVVGTGRVTLITNPGSPADLLWRRFFEAVDPASSRDLPSPGPATVHGGVTMPEADVLNALNAELTAKGWQPNEIKRLGNQIIDAFAGREARGPRVGIPAAFRTHVDEWTRSDLDDLRQSGIRIVGDLNELVYAATSEPAEPTVDQVVKAAGIAGRVAATESAAGQGALPTAS